MCHLASIELTKLSDHPVPDIAVFTVSTTFSHHLGHYRTSEHKTCKVQGSDVYMYDYRAAVCALTQNVS